MVLTIPMQLFKADPSGWYAGYRAAAIGQKGEEANNIFEKKLRAKPALPANEPIVTGLIALQSALGVDLKANEVEVGVCSKDAPRFRTLSEAEVCFILHFFCFIRHASSHASSHTDRHSVDANGGQRLNKNVVVFTQPFSIECQRSKRRSNVQLYFVPRHASN